MKKFLKTISYVIFANTLLLPSITPHAHAFATRPVRIIVPLTAGGSMDSVARALSARLGDNLKQSVVIDNRPGAGALIALDILSSAARSEEHTS